MKTLLGLVALIGAGVLLLWGGALVFCRAVLGGFTQDQSRNCRNPWDLRWPLQCITATPIEAGADLQYERAREFQTQRLRGEK